MALPERKLAKAVSMIKSVQRACKVGRRGLDSLFGYFSFCAIVSYGGRVFLHSVCRLRFRPDGVAQAGHHWVHVSAALREDRED